MKNFFKKSGLLFPETGLKDNNLDIIRFSLAIVVLFCHCFVMYYGTEETVEPLWEASNHQLSLGSLAVNFFFIISGFLIIQSWDKNKDVGNFLKKRILRIFPAFVVASLICLLVFAPLGTSDYYQPFGYWKLYYQSINIFDYLKSILVLNEPTVPWTLKNVPIKDSINAPLWTIRYEFICYLLVPILGVLGVYKNKAILLLLTLIAFVLHLVQDYFALYYFDWQEYPLIGKPDFLPRFFTYFLVGVCYYNFKKQIPRSKIAFAISLIVVFIGLFLVKGVNIVLPICGSYVLFYIAFNQTITFKNFTKSGDFSYGIYVYAWPVQQLVILYFEKYLNISLLFILSVMFTLPMAWLSWHYVEKSFLKLNKKPKETMGQNTEIIHQTPVISLHLN